jgi:hypothetical protein
VKVAANEPTHNASKGIWLRQSCFKLFTREGRSRTLLDYSLFLFAFFSFISTFVSVWVWVQMMLLFADNVYELLILIVDKWYLE